MGRRDALAQDALLGVHVVVVDDDASARDLLKTVLEYCGALVTVVESAPDALRALQRVTPDVLLSDIAMPEHDGYWLIDQLRMLPTATARAVPAVAITGHSDVHGPDRTLGSGFTAHLRKPVDPWELCRVIANLARRA
jgi:CheY-like chemotaxis protein